MASYNAALERMNGVVTSSCLAPHASSLSIALTSPYDYACPGGVTEHVRALACHLRDRGHQVTVIAPTSCPDNHEAGFIPLRAPIHALPINGSVARVALSPFIWHEIRTLLQHPYDIVHVHEPTVPPLSLAVLHHARVPVIGTFHHYHQQDPYHEWTHTLTRRFVGKLAARIAVSDAAETTAAPYFPAQYHRIPNGVEVERYRTAIPFPLRQHDFNIVFVGRLEPRKGLYHLLQAFAHVKTHLPHAKLWVVGAYSASEKRPYVRWVRHHGVHGVRFVGHVNDEEKARWYKSADLVCAPSTGYESFGIVLLEAMAAGVPIIASDIPGYREVVQHNATGFLVPAADSTALADAIIALARDTAYRDTLAANATAAVARYDWHTVTEAVEHLYYQVLHRHGESLPTFASTIL